MNKPNMANLFKQVQKMQEDLSKAQEELSKMTVEGSSGGGMVTVRANGKQEIIGIKIDPEVVNKDDVEMLEDLIVAAINQAMEKASEMAQEHMGKMTSGILPNLPPGFKLPGMGL